MFGKPKSAATGAAAYLAVVMAVTSSLQLPSTTSWCWLDSRKDLPEEVSQTRQALLCIYRLAHTVMSATNASSVLSHIFGRMLQADAISFLASVWASTNDCDVALKRVAILDAVPIIDILTKRGHDVQVLLPSLYGALASEDRSLREAGCNVLLAIQQGVSVIRANVDPLGCSSFYGTSSGKPA